MKTHRSKPLLGSFRMMYSLGLPLNQQWQIKWTFIAISVLKMQSSWRWLACWVGGTPPNFVMTAQPIPPHGGKGTRLLNTSKHCLSIPWAVLSPLPKLWTLPCQKATSLWGVMHRSMPAPQTLYISLPGILPGGTGIFAQEPLGSSPSPTHRPAKISKFRMQISVWYGLRESKG